MSCHRQPPAKVDVLSQYMAKVHHPIIDASEVNRPTRTENSAHSSSISSSKAECQSVSHIMRQWKYDSKLFPHCLCLGFLWECQGHNEWHGNARVSKNAAKCFVFFLNAVICRSYRQTDRLGISKRESSQGLFYEQIALSPFLSAPFPFTVSSAPLQI